jgi:hypothetical protein
LLHFEAGCVEVSTSPDEVTAAQKETVGHDTAFVHPPGVCCFQVAAPPVGFVEASTPVAAPPTQSDVVGQARLLI